MSEDQKQYKLRDCHNCSKTKSCDSCGMNQRDIHTCLSNPSRPFHEFRHGMDGIPGGCSMCNYKTYGPVPDECVNCEDGSNFIQTDLQPGTD